MKKSQKVATGGVSASDIDVGLSYCGIWSAWIQQFNSIARKRGFGNTLTEKLIGKYNPVAFLNLQAFTAGSIQPPATLH